MELIGLLHYSVPIIHSLYLIFAPLKWDVYMFIWLNILVLHWILLKNECLISYIHKKFHNPNYKIGEDVNVKDMTNVFTGFMSENNAIILVNIINYGVFIGLFLRFFIFKSVHPIITCITFILFAIYTFLIKLNLTDKFPLFKIILVISILSNFYLVYRYNLNKK